MLFKFNKVFTLAAFFLGLTVSIGNAANDKSKSDKVLQVMNVYEAVVQYPAPVWSQNGKTLDQSEYFRKQNGSQFIFEQIPKGETFKNWTQMYAVRGDYIKLDKVIPLDAYISLNLKPFVDVCGKENISFEKLFGAQSSATFVLTCEDSPKAPKGTGYGKGIGEIALFHFSKVKNTYVKIYHEWRGKSFSGSNPKSWPVDPQVLAQAIGSFKQIRVSSAQ